MNNLTLRIALVGSLLVTATQSYCGARAKMAQFLNFGAFYGVLSYGAVTCSKLQSDLKIMREKFNQEVKAVMDYNTTGENHFFNEEHETAYKRIIEITKQTVQVHDVTNCLIVPWKEACSLATTKDGTTDIFLVGTEYPCYFNEKHVKAGVTHEIGHIKNKDFEGGSFLITMCFQGTRDNIALTCSAGFLKIAADVMTRNATGVRSFCLSLALATGVIALTKTNSMFLGSFLSRYRERRADRYIIDTAFKTKDPGLLDAAAEFFVEGIFPITNKYDTKKTVSSEENEKDPSHPSGQERHLRMTQAAQELRTYIKSGKKTPFQEFVFGL